MHQGSPKPSNGGPLRSWRQGDFAFDVCGFLFAGKAEGNNTFTAEESPEGIVGHIAISQTCDIIPH